MADLNVRILLEMVDRVSGPSRKIKRELRGIGKEGKRATKSFDLAANLNQAAEGVARLAQQAERLLIKPVVQFADFQKAVAEVSTLIDESVISQEKLAQISEDAAATFGGPAVDQAKALYQVISSGADNASDATERLNVANQLAIGGVTDTKTAVEALAKSMNAYKESGLTATEASDSLFTAVKGGITTIEQLSSNVGKVAPIAAQAGVSFDEMNAAIATITKTGLSTDEAATALRATISGILKPSKDTAKAALDMSLAFDVAALQSKGLAKFLNDMIEASGPAGEELSKLAEESEKTGVPLEDLVKNSSTATQNLVKLFPNVRALGGVLALTANKGEEFSDQMAAMAEKTGASAAAADKMGETQSQAFKRAEAQLDILLRTLGEGFAPAVADALKDVVALAQSITAFAEAHPEAVRRVGSLLIKLIAVGAALRVMLLLVSTLSSAKGLLGLSKAAGAAAGEVGGLGTVLKQTATGGKGLLKMLAGNAGLIALAGLAGFALGAWADEAFDLSNKLAGVSREQARLNALQGRGGVSLLGDIAPEDRASLKAAQDELAKLEAKREELTGTFAGPSDVELERFTDIPKRIRAAQAEIKAIEARGRTRATERREDEAIPFFGPVQPAATPLETAAQLEEQISRVKVDMVVKDDRVVTTVSSQEGNVETTIDGGIAGVGA